MIHWQHPSSIHVKPRTRSWIHFSNPVCEGSSILGVYSSSPTTHIERSVSGDLHYKVFRGFFGVWCVCGGGVCFVVVVVLALSFLLKADLLMAVGGWACGSWWQVLHLTPERSHGLNSPFPPEELLSLVMTTSYRFAFVTSTSLHLLKLLEIDKIE